MANDTLTARYTVPPEHWAGSLFYLAAPEAVAHFAAVLDRVAWGRKLVGQDVRSAALADGSSRGDAGGTV